MTDEPQIEHDEWQYVNALDATAARKFFGLPPDAMAEPIPGALPDETGRRVFRVKP